MRLGAAYNLFDGEELLEDSLKSIRSSVDFIIVIYQDISNFGHFSKIDLLSFLNGLKERGLLDDFILYTPDLFMKGHRNEIIKRNLGLEICKENRCTHFLSIDTDEFYKNDQLNYAKELIESKDFDSSACQMKTFYKTPEWRLDPPEQYYVPFIYKIDERIFNKAVWPIFADPTRRMLPKKLKLFNRDELEMFHYSYVRKDIEIKLKNSSASVNFSNRINEISKYWDEWVPGTPVLVAGKEKKIFSVKKEENIFNINI